ncbi:SET domain-containing protein [Dichomitus squalens]|uniref:SET domain-containing protein n=1 Tax=Dichomitus squalens TaxID=114155 RepID=A0A4Q9PPD3_9APHY|nr:SET domain-containing protein [Dichomitus squalens]
MSSIEPENVTNFKSWIAQQGGQIHAGVHFEPVEFGFNVTARSDIPSDATVVSIPFSLAITPNVARHAIKQLLNTEPQNWSERQLKCTYIVLHSIVEPIDPSILRHRPYLDTLPSPEQLRTPLHFTEAELSSFRGSNLFGATLDRKHEWETEWQQCKNTVSAAIAGWGQSFTWEKYLTAATYLSSRAFPSTILSDTPSLVTTETSYPVLLPGIDALNHARGHPVSWVVSAPSQTSSSQRSESSISLVIHTPTPRGSELLNNYGPKPNSELILGYGFSLPNNPDDTIVLKIGGSSAPASIASPSALRGWEVGRHARGAEPVWEAVLSAVRGQKNDTVDDDDEGSAVEDELCAADMLAEMAQGLHDRLPPFPPANTSEIRPEVLQMLEHYLEGQRDILQSLVSFAQEKEARALQMAKEQGLDIVDEEEEGDY